jgi:AbrB family looped-hinge helix DNA binding protein
MTIARITTKGQVTIPAQVRKTLGLKEGDALFFEVTDQHEARIRVIKRQRLTELYGALPATRAFPGKEATRTEVGQHLGERLSQPTESEQ